MNDLNSAAYRPEEENSSAGWLGGAVIIFMLVLSAFAIHKAVDEIVRTTAEGLMTANVQTQLR